VKRGFLFKYFFKSAQHKDIANLIFFKNKFDLYRLLLIFRVRYRLNRLYYLNKRTNLLKMSFDTHLKLTNETHK